MLYTLAEAAKATGLEESILLKALEAGQMFGTQDLSGEWHVEDDEIYRLYLFVAQQYCKRKCRAGLPSKDGTTSEAEIAASITDGDAGIRQQHIDNFGDSRTGAGQAETSRGTPTTVPTLDHEIRTDDRDKISISDSCLGFHQTRITRMAFVALGYIVALSSYYFLSQSLVSEQKVNSLAHFSSETEAISSTPVEGRSGGETVGKTSVIGNEIDHSHVWTQNSQAPNSNAAVARPDTLTEQTAPKKSQAKLVPKLVPAPETKPTTIKGWTVRNVIDGTAVLEGPNGFWKVARGDMVPGLGRVDSIVLWGSRWIVVTSKGLITTR